MEREIDMRDIKPGHKIADMFGGEQQHEVVAVTPKYADDTVELTIRTTYKNTYPMDERVKIVDT